MTAHGDEGNDHGFSLGATLEFLKYSFRIAGVLEKEGIAAYLEYGQARDAFPQKYRIISGEKRLTRMEFPVFAYYRAEGQRPPERSDTMDGTPKTRPLSDEQMEDITGGLILPEAWSKIKEMAREKKHEGMNYKQFYNYLVKWRAETGMEGFCEGNLVRDFDSLADYAHEEWKYL